MFWLVFGEEKMQSSHHFKSRDLEHLDVSKQREKSMLPDDWQRCGCRGSLACSAMSATKQQGKAKVRAAYGEWLEGAQERLACQVIIGRGER